jgi:anti-sigma B factor antagonist
MTVSAKDGYSIVELNGRLDILTFQTVGDRLTEIIGDGQKKLILDAQKLSYVSSAGLRVILQARKTLKPQGGGVIIARANDFVMDVMSTTGFTSIIPCYPTLEEAEKAISA